MIGETVIKVENLSKSFKLYNSPKHRLLEAIHPLRKLYHHDYHALKNVNFEIKKGEAVGILGRNGAGKSTLLKLLTGVLTPTSGKIQVQGRIAALLELGSGFNPELTGLENIFFQGAIMGFKKEEMDIKVKEVIDFAEIGEFIYQPVKTYSSGMFARLAFSIAINVDPDILIIDEALSVGDAIFQAKCMLKLRSMINAKKLTLLFVSHSTFAVRNLCQSALLLDGGELVKYGPAAEISELYFSLNVKANQNTQSDSGSVPNQNKQSQLSSFGRLGNGQGQFKSVVLSDSEGKIVNSVYYGQEVNLKFDITFNHDIECVGYGFHIRNTEGIEVLYFSTGAEVDFLYDVKAKTRIVVNNVFTLPLIQGNYTIAVVLVKPIDSENVVAEYIDFIPLAYHFEMQKRLPTQIYGLVGLNNKSTIEIYQ
jgi:lipopolysaccharide transport system ATP-binding protein